MHGRHRSNPSRVFGFAGFVVDVDPPFVVLVVEIAKDRGEFHWRGVEEIRGQLADFLAEGFGLGEPAGVFVVLVDQAMPMLLGSERAGSPEEKAEQLGAVGDGLPGPQANLAGAGRALEIGGLPAGAGLLLENRERE